MDKKIKEITFTEDLGFGLFDTEDGKYMFKYETLLDNGLGTLTEMDTGKEYSIIDIMNNSVGNIYSATIDLKSSKSEVMSLKEFNEKYLIDIKVETIHSADMELNSNGGISVNMLDWESTSDLMHATVYNKKSGVAVFNSSGDSDMIDREIIEQFNISLDSDQY